MSGALPTSPEFNALSFKDEVNTLVSISDSGRRFARQIDNQRWKFTCKYVAKAFIINDITKSKKTNKPDRNKNCFSFSIPKSLEN